jgi:hypothetical protein
LGFARLPYKLYAQASFSSVTGTIMKTLTFTSVLLAATVMVGAAAIAQTTPPKQHTDGNSPTVVGPASGAYKQGTQGVNHSMNHSMASKQATDGNSPTMVGPGSGAFKQHTDGSSPTMVGPASGAFKQHTDGSSPTVVGPASGAYKQN